MNENHSLYVNKYDIELFNAVFDRRYFEALKLLTLRKQKGKIKLGSFSAFK